MKKRLTVLLSIFLCVRLFAQSPEAINYQAVARNNLGVPLVNTNVAVTFDIRQGSSSGTSVYTETHTSSTNAFGLFTLEIGNGTPVSGVFSGINWGAGSYYLYVEVNGDPMGATQLLSVPYALYSKESANGPQGLPGKNSLMNSTAEPAGLNCTNGGYFIESGLDANTNGVLDAAEVQISYYICNGIDGANGTNGVNGADGVGIVSTTDNGDGTFTFNYSDASSFTTSDLTGPAGANGTTYYPGNGIVFSNDTIINTGDLDNDPTNEIELPAAGNFNDVLTWDGSAWISQAPSSTGDDWGSDVVNVSGANISGDGTILNPIVVSDGDTDPNNEFQTLSISNDTLFLSNGNNVQLPSSTGDNWGSQIAITDGVNIIGDGTAGSPISLAATIPTNTSDLTNDSGFITSPNDADADPNNEIQNLSFTSPNLTISGGNTVDLSSLSGSSYTAGSDIDITGNVVTNTAPDQTVVIQGAGATTVTGTYPNFTISSTDNVNNSDTSATNEIQDLTITGNYITVTGGTGDSISATTPNTGEYLYWNGSDWVGNSPSSLWTQGTGVIYHNTDNVGIGTSTTVSKLDVSGNARLGQGKLFLGAVNGVDDGYGGIYSDGDDLKLAVFKSLNATNFGTNSLDALTIQGTTGHVGVGTTSPTSLFHLNGSLRLEGLAGSPPATGSVLTAIDAQGNAEWKSPTNLWQQGVGNDVYYLDSVGIGTNNPISQFQIGNYHHQFVLDLAADEHYSVNSYNAYWDGTVVRNANNGPANIIVNGEDNGEGSLQILLYDSSAANTDLFGSGSFFKYNFKDKGLAINKDNPYAAVDIQPKDTSGIILRLAENSQPSSFLFEDTQGYMAGLRSAPVMTNNYTLTLPVTLPSNTNSPLVSDVNGNLSWGAPAAAPIWNLNISDITYNYAGNVGIGVTPSNKLDVNGDIHTSGYYKMDGAVFLNNINNNTFVGNTNNFSITTGQNNAVVGRFAGEDLSTGSLNTFLGFRAGGNNTAGSGNVFIGSYAGQNEMGSNLLYIDNSTTTTPLIWGDFTANQLAINGSLRINDGTQAANKVLTSDASGNATWQNLPTPAMAWQTNGANISNANSGNVGIGMVNPTHFFHIQDSTTSGTTTLMRVEDNLGVPIFEVNNNRNVGIGVIPTRKLHIGNGGFKYTDIGPSNFDLYRNGSDFLIEIDNGSFAVAANGGSVGFRMDDGNVNFYLPLRIQDGTQAANKVLTSDASGNASWQNLPAPPTTFWSGSAGVVYPTTLADNVGVGTSNPNNKLHLSGNYSSTGMIGTYLDLQNTFGSSTSPAKVGIRFKTSNYANGQHVKGGIIYSRTTTNGRGDIHFLNNSNDDVSEIDNLTDTKMIIKNDGNVGVGTNSPSQKLDVNGNVIAANYQYATPKVFHYSAGAGNFRPAGTFTNGFNTVLGNGQSYLVSGWGYIVSDLNLPDGARITGVKINYEDESTEDVTVYLRSYNLNGSTNAFHTFTSSGSVVGVRTYTNNAINYTIDNLNNSYYIGVAATWPDQSAGNKLNIRGVVVTYEMNSTH